MKHGSSKLLTLKYSRTHLNATTIAQEIVLVSQFAQYVEVWQRNEHDPNNPKAWLYRHYGPDDTIDLVSIDVQIEIAEVYRGLVFHDGEEE